MLLLICEFVALHHPSTSPYPGSCPDHHNLTGVSFLLPSPQLMVSLLLCLLDWCMAVPLGLLLEPITMPVLDDPASHKAPLLDYIYRVGRVGRVGSSAPLGRRRHTHGVQPPPQL